MTQSDFPRFRAVAGHAVLVELAGTASPATTNRLRDLDAALAHAPLPGVVEAVPATVSLLVVFDPGKTDHRAVTQGLRALLARPGTVPRPAPALHQVALCHDADLAPDLAPDLAEVARLTGLAPQAVIAAHLAATFQVQFYGFAPGYAYLSGLPAALHLPRKPAARRAVPAGSVIIAGGHCLITTLTMPTGWWIIGRTTTRILRDDPARPFLFDLGDTVRFHPISRAAFDAGQGA